MRTQSLDGAWRLWHMVEGEMGEGVRDPLGLSSCGVAPIAALVPGNVELDLVRAGQLPEPFQGTNIELLRELESHEWWYQREFTLLPEMQGRRMELYFGGVDCFATYWLNGEYLGESANMLVEQSFDVTGKVITGGPNTLTVRLASAVNAARSFDYPPALAGQVMSLESLHVRKAPHMYGWDIMCRAVSAGLWRGVELRAHGDAELRDLYLAPRSVSEEHASVQLSYTFETSDWGLADYELLLRGRLVPGSGGKGAAAGKAETWEARHKPLFTSGRFEFGISNPHLWWPAGYGEQPLYDVDIDLVKSGQVVASARETIGIRTVELLRTDMTSPERPGEFLFKVNGAPIMVKGTNWVPLDAFHSRDAAKYESAVALVADLGCNMVRCWGGNVYEDHAFFSLCDRAGILVWQDFAMACASYPHDAAFQAALGDEVAKVVKKLRNHPALALWSGDNECDEAYTWLGLKPGANLVTRGIVKDTAFAYDPYRPYLPSSPYYSPDVVARGSDIRFMPEQHLWGPRDYFKSSFYTEHTAHFVSEIGYHGCPNVSSLKRFLDEDKLWPYAGNDQWRIHATDPVPGGSSYSYRVDLMADQIRELFGQIPSDLETFAIASQVSQAEAKKFFVEMTRLGKWRRTGLIWWNALDGWPQFSDAIVDYYMSKKLAYYYIRRVQQPVCIMLAEPKDWHCRVVVGNDSMRPASGHYRVWDGDTQETLLEGAYGAPANANCELGRIKASHGEHRLLLIEWDVAETGERLGNHYCLGKPPFSLERYLTWLERISELHAPFDNTAVGK